MTQVQHVSAKQIQHNVSITQGQQNVSITEVHLDVHITQAQCTVTITSTTSCQYNPSTPSIPSTHKYSAMSVSAAN